MRLIAIKIFSTLLIYLFYTMGPAKFKDNLMAIQPNLLHFAYALTSNRDDAYDLLQDTTLKALDSRDKYVDDTNFKAWAFTIMRNTFINGYRRKVRIGTVVDSTDDQYLINLTHDNGMDTPQGSMAVNEINSAVDALDDLYRIPFSLFIAGYKYAEISVKTDLPIGTVKSRIYFARQKLMKALEDYRTR